MSGEKSVEEVRRASNYAGCAVLGVIALYFLILTFGAVPVAHVADGHEPPAHGSAESPFVPSVWAVLPFASLLLAIAVLPLIPFTEHWWHYNRNRFIVAAGLGTVTLVYYALVHPGGIDNHFTFRHSTPPGLETVSAVFSNAVFTEYIPFIILLFSLYVISGGINLRGDLPAHPLVNCAFLGTGTVLASFIGTTGAAMLLVRPLLKTNSERKYQVHTVLFFIFMVCNCGGLLLPIGDPPLFLGYLKGVPFTWTLRLWPFWLGVNLCLLCIYYVWDRINYSREPIESILRDESRIEPLKLSGLVNVPLILAVVLCVGLVVPGEHLFGTSFITPNFLREALMLGLVALSLFLTRPEPRILNRFDYHAIVEVAALFFGIFICMQVPIEILHAKGGELGITSPAAFFWATGLLSSFLDNAPTYVVFFETAAALPVAAGLAVLKLVGGRAIVESLLVAVSLGAVFMGANTYIGNGPNFMVKSIAEQSGVKMPSFFGYMFYSTLILVPVWVVTSLLV